jgi:hypothetical protein
MQYSSDLKYFTLGMGPEPQPSGFKTQFDVQQARISKPISFSSITPNDEIIKQGTAM